MFWLYSDGYLKYLLRKYFWQIWILAPNKSPNGLKCKSCRSIYDENCDSDLDCVGNQDRCFNGTGMSYSLLSVQYLKKVSFNTTVIKLETHNLCVCVVSASLLPSSFGFGNNTLKGCISRDLCQPSKFSNMTCCEGSFCNKGLSWMGDVNISLLFLSLIAFVSL